MTDLFERVFHHIEGTETEIQNWHTLDGIKTVEFHSFGPDRWIESVHERGRMTGIECLAMILFEVDVSFSDPEPARRIVEAWAVELRKAVSAGEIQARDPVTLLKLETLPDGWEWLLSMADADKFIAARGMEWRFGEVALHLFNEFEQAIENRRFPPWERETKQPAPAQTASIPAPVVAGDLPDTVERPKVTRRTWRDVAWLYLVETFKAGQYSTAKDYYRALENKAGASDSPFDKGTGLQLHSLYVREMSETVTLKTIQNAWAEIKASR